MKTQSFVLSARSNWSVPQLPDLDSERSLVIAFGSRAVGDVPEVFASLARAFPRSQIIGCSTAGEISGSAISDDTLVVAATRFDSTELRMRATPITSAKDSFSAGATLAKELAAPGLRAVF